MSENIAKLMWNAYAIRAGGKTFDGKPLPTWDELGEDRQSCWVAAASVAVDEERIEKLELALVDMSQYVSRADWCYLKPETLAALEGKDD